MRYDGAYGGLRFGAMYGFGNVPGSMKTSSKYDFALGYESGPFAAVVTFDRQNGAADSVTPADPVNYVQGIHAGVSYDFGRLKTMAGYRNYRRTYHTAAATQLSDMYWLGGSYDFTPAFSLTGALYHQNIKGGTDADPTLVSLRAIRAVQAHGAVRGGRLRDRQARAERQRVARLGRIRGYPARRDRRDAAAVLSAAADRERTTSARRHGMNAGRHGVRRVARTRSSRRAHREHRA